IMAHNFPEGAAEIHRSWLLAAARSANTLICISEAVANDTRQWLINEDPKLIARTTIEACPLGADIDASSPSTGLPKNAAKVLSQIRAHKSFLMVGTIEPRKGHQQVLDAFEKLWRQGYDTQLVIVGAEGWKGLPDADRRDIPATTDRLSRHPELGKRLFWLDRVSDEYLEKIYGAVVCLIAASAGEGFGLPLIEAARHRTPLFVRDLPVFREVAGDNAFYFDGVEPEDIAEKIVAWLDLHEKGQVPVPDGIFARSWAESVELLKVLLFDEGGTSAKADLIADHDRGALSAIRRQAVPSEKATVPPPAASET
ncbi:MAG: glycosyltransferase family 4 protein, partial [Pararhizobium sp.]